MEKKKFPDSEQLHNAPVKYHIAAIGVILGLLALMHVLIFQGLSPHVVLEELVTVQQHHIFGRSAQLTYMRYAAPVRLSKSAALLNGYSPAVLVLW